VAQRYPWSRISMRNCPQCKTHRGHLAVRGATTVDNAAGEKLELLRVTCDYCGYTLLFDASVMTTAPYEDGDEELPPTDGA